MPRRLPWIAAAALGGLLGAWWLASLVRTPPSPPPPARGEPAATEAPATGSPATGSPATAAPAPSSPPALFPARCALDLGPAPPDELRYSWRAVVLDDRLVPPAELSARIRARARTAHRGPDGYDLRVPPAADLLLVLDRGRIGAALPLAWEDDGPRCVDPQPEVPVVRVAGRVEGASGGAGIEVHLCGRWLPVDPQGRFEGTAPARRDCVAFASRRDGALSALGRMVDLDLSSGAQRDDLLLELPAGETAGVGAVLQVVDGGVEVLDVLPGGPAAAGGLRPGERVVQVDGADLAGWTLAEVVAAITGPAGAKVELLVDGPQGGRRLLLVRAPIAAP